MLDRDDNKIEIVKRKLEAMKGEIRSASSVGSAKAKLDRALELMGYYGLYEFAGDLLQAYLDNPSVQAELQSGKSSSQSRISFIQEEFDKIHTKLDQQISASKDRLTVHYNVTDKHYNKFLHGNAEQALISLDALLKEGEEKNVAKHVNIYGKHKNLLLKKAFLIEEEERSIINANNGYIDPEIAISLKNRKEAAEKELEKERDKFAEHYTKLAIAQISKEAVVGKEPVTEKNILEVQATAQELDRSEQRNRLKQTFINLEQNIMGTPNDGREVEKQFQATIDKHLEEVKARREAQATAKSEDLSFQAHGLVSKSVLAGKQEMAKTERDLAPLPTIPEKAILGQAIPLASPLQDTVKPASKEAAKPTKPVPRHIQAILDKAAPLTSSLQGAVEPVSNETAKPKKLVPRHIQAILDKHPEGHDPTKPPKTPGNSGNKKGRQ